MVFVDSFVRSFVDTISLSLDGFDLPPFFFIFPSLPPPTMECLNFFFENTGDPGTNTVLLMTSSLRNSQSLSEFLSEMDPDMPPGTQGKKMMEEKLRMYLWWKAKVTERKQERKGPSTMTTRGTGRGNNHSDSVASGSGSGSGRGTAVGDGELSEALKKKDRERQARAASRRRVRGGAPTPTHAGSSSRDNHTSAGASGGDARTLDEAQTIAEL